MSYTTWQPIETAPKDRRILLYYARPCFTGMEVQCGKWNPDEYVKRPKPYWANDVSWLRKGLATTHSPTHWMPLPELPGKDKR